MYIMPSVISRVFKFFTFVIFIILNSGVSYDGSKKDYTIHPTASDINTYDKTIVLYYEDGLHFQLVGYFQKDRMIKKFTREDIPNQLLEIYNKDTNNF